MEKYSYSFLVTFVLSEMKKNICVSAVHIFARTDWVGGWGLGSTLLSWMAFIRREPNFQ